MITRFGERPFIAAGLSLNALALIWVALTADPDLAYWQIAAPLVLSGTGVAMSIPAAQSSVLTSVPRGDIGKTSGTFSTLRQLGGAFGVAVLVAVLHRCRQLRLRRGVQRRLCRRDGCLRRPLPLGRAGQFRAAAPPNVSDFPRPDTQAVPAFESDGR